MQRINKVNEGIAQIQFALKLTKDSYLIVYWKIDEVILPPAIRADFVNDITQRVFIWNIPQHQSSSPIFPNNDVVQDYFRINILFSFKCDWIFIAESTAFIRLDCSWGFDAVIDTKGKRLKVVHWSLRMVD